MTHVLNALRSVAVGAALASAGTTMATAETFESTIADMRTLAAFKVDNTALSEWIPDTHSLAPFGGGSFEGANVLMMFIDRMLHQDANGDPTSGGAYRMMALIVPAIDTTTDESATFIARVYTPSEGVGTYGTAVQSSVSHELALSGTDIGPLSGSHAWRIEHGGGSLEIAFDYEAGIPGRRSGESVLSTPVDPEVQRIYRFEQLTDVVYSVPRDIDRTSNVTVRIDIPELAAMFDGAEELIGLADRPFYTRTTWKP